MNHERLVNSRPLESAVFRRRVATASINTESEVETVLAEAREEGAELLVIRVAADRIGTIQKLEQLGGQLCDVLVTFSRLIPSGGLVTDVSAHAWHLRQARAEDAAALHTLALEAFADFPGHWHSDPRLGKHNASELYGRWAADLASRDGADETLLVAEACDGQMAAFLALSRATDGWHVPLTAVHPRFRGKGLLGHLLVAASDKIACDTTPRLDYETQLTNYAAIAVVARFGFVPQASRVTLHFWPAEA